MVTKNHLPSIEQLQSFFSEEQGPGQKPGPQNIPHVDMSLLLKEMQSPKNEDMVKFFQEKILPELPYLDPLQRDVIIDQSYQLLKPFGITRETIKKMVKLSMPEGLPQVKNEEMETAKTEPSAVFPGLIDIVVDTSGQPVFLTLEGMEGLNNQCQVSYAEIKNEKVPPNKDAMPWQLPRLTEVLRWCDKDNDEALFYDLVDYHKKISELPSTPYYYLLAAYDMLTYLQDKVQYFPMLVFEGLPERGKSRTGKGIIYVAYRGIHETTVRDTHLFRYCAEFNATLFIDTMDLWKKVEKNNSEDVILGRYEKGQTVRRVLWPEKGLYQDSVYYEIFGPTIIATNRSINHILETRALSISLPEARMVFNNDVSPETSLPLRERLVAFRARHLNSPLPEVDKPCNGRLGDITKPLVQVIKMVCPDRENDIRALIEEFRQQRLAEKSESFEAKVFEAFLACEEKVNNGVLLVSDIASEVNKDRPENKKLSPQRIGKILSQIGLQKATKHEKKNAYVWPTKEEIIIFKKGLGLIRDIPPSPPCPPLTPEAESKVSNNTNINPKPKDVWEGSPDDIPF